MSQIFLSFRGNSRNRSKVAKLQEVLASDPKFWGSLLGAVSLKGGVLTVGGRNFAGCKAGFSPPEPGAQREDGFHLILDTNIDDAFISLFDKFPPGCVQLTDAGIADAHFSSGIGVIVDNVECVHGLFSLITRISDVGGMPDNGGGAISSFADEEERKKAEAICESSKRAMNRIFARSLDYYLTRAISYISVGGYDVGGEETWELDEQFLHSSPDGRALLCDEVSTGILSTFYSGNAIVSPIAGPYGRYRRAFIQCVLDVIDRLPKSIISEVMRDGSVKKRSYTNFLCACNVETYSSEQCIKEGRTAARILDMLKSIEADFPSRYDEAVGMLAIAHIFSKKKYNKALMRSLRADESFSRACTEYEGYDLERSGALYSRLHGQYDKVVKLMRSYGAEPPSFPEFCFSSFFESLFSLTYRCNAWKFQLRLPIRLDNIIKEVRSSDFVGMPGRVTNLQPFTSSSGTKPDTSCDEGNLRRRRARLVMLRKIVAAFVIAAFIAAMMALLYHKGIINYSGFAATFGVICAIAVLITIWWVYAYFKSADLDTQVEIVDPKLTLCINILDRKLFDIARQQESVDGFGIVSNVVHVADRPLPSDKYNTRILDARDDLPCGMCVLLSMESPDSFGMRLLGSLSNRTTAWPKKKNISLKIALADCPSMGSRGCSVNCTIDAKWTSRSSHVLLIKTLAACGRIGPLLAYLDAYAGIVFDENGRVDPKFHTSAQWKYLYRDHIDRDIIGTIYKYCTPYLGDRRMECLQHICDLINMHSHNPGKYKTTCAFLLTVLGCGPGFPFNEASYRSVLLSEEGVSFNHEQLHFAHAVGMRFTNLMFSDDCVITYPQVDYSGEEEQLNEGQLYPGAGGGDDTEPQKPYTAPQNCKEEPALDVDADPYDMPRRRAQLDEGGRRSATGRGF
ncbi:MAG: hypothetical protein ACTJLK_03830 [Anaplasma sp.]